MAQAQQPQPEDKGQLKVPLSNHKSSRAVNRGMSRDKVKSVNQRMIAEVSPLMGEDAIVYNKASNEH